MKTKFLFRIIIIGVFTFLFSSCSRFSPTTKPEISQSDNLQVENWAGIWKSEYNSQDIAEIKITDETNKGFNFIYSSAEYDLDQNIQIAGFYGTAKKDGENTAAFLVPEKEFGASMASAEGVFRLNNGVLTISFDKMESYGNAIPAGLSKPFIKSDDSIITKMPFNLYEISLFDIPIRNDFPPKLEEMLGTPTSSVKKPWKGNENYFEIKYDGITINSFEDSNDNYGFISRIEITKPDISLCRGIKVGDSIDSVLSKFPSPQNRIEKDYDEGRDARVLYGKTQHMSSGGFIVIEGDKPVKIMYLDRGVLLEFYFDDNANVNKIVYAREG